MCVITKPALLLSQIFGYLPVKYKSSKEFQHFVFSPAVFLWSLIVISLQTGFVGFTFYYNYQNPKSELSAKAKVEVTNLADFLDIVPLSILAFVIFISSTKKFKHFIKMCDLIERASGNLNIKKNSNKITLKLYLILIFTIAIYGFTVFIFAKHGRFLEAITFRTIHLAEAAFLIHFSQAIQNIADLFRIFNQKFKHDIIRMSFGQLMTNHNLPDVEHTCSKASPTSKPKHNVIKHLTRVYWLLHQAKSQANLFYGSQLLFAIFTSFVHSTLSLNNSLLALWQGFELEGLPRVVLQMVWAVVHFSFIALLVWPCNDLTVAANETAQTVCKLVSRDLSPELKDQMDSFLLQLLHHSTSIAAMGFFPLQKHILISIGSAVATYLVVMMQFHVRTHN